MVCYETLVLVNPNATNEELDNLENQFTQLVKKASGTINTIDRWGKRQLAYPVRKNNYGIYILIQYSIPAEKLSEVSKEIVSFFQIKFNELALRHVNVKLEKGFRPYRKPEAFSAELKNHDADMHSEEENSVDA